MLVFIEIIIFGMNLTNKSFSVDIVIMINYFVTALYLTYCICFSFRSKSHVYRSSFFILETITEHEKVQKIVKFGPDLTQPKS